MSLYNRHFSNNAAKTEETIESLMSDLKREKSVANPNQDKIAEIKQKIRRLENIATYNDQTVNRDFRTNH